MQQLRRRAAAAIVGAGLGLLAAPVAGDSRPWLDAPLGYLLRTEAEFGVDVALVLRIVGQLTGDGRALEVAEIRRLGFEPAQLRELAPLFTLELPVLAPARRAVQPSAPPPLPPRPSPPDRRTPDGGRANAATCLGPAATCALSPGCVDWATDEQLTGLELTHQAAWLLFARWRGCPLELDADAFQASLAGRLLSELAAGSDYSETHLERVAMLGQLGYGDRIETEWVRSIVAARSSSGCWGATPGGFCHPHPTALALWALAVAERSGRWPESGAQAGNGGP